ncbi:homeobox protein 3-like [Ctenocephalides felis]|uniref:homeobox protein 3-like n=1 Tax=Ctenocephalides felis TaxID=7515 RepID=UPI000E6E3F09|nr:homeobox protein 3-like [Ctenocephalides felis]XP_026482760.1 homeobox protein 3-like [Ctenocephalides felis]
MDSLENLNIKKEFMKFRLTQIHSFCKRIRENESSKLDISELKQILEILKPSLDTFQKLLIQIANHFDDEEYIDFLIDTEFYDFNDTYTKCCVILRTTIKTFKTDPSSNSGIGDKSYQTNNNKFAVINLPHFDGTDINWLQFYNSFYSIHIDPNISNSQKYSYLKSCLKGEAGNIIESLPATADNYINVGKLLKSRYESKTIIVNNHTKTLNNYISIPSESITFNESNNNKSKNVAHLETINVFKSHTVKRGTTSVLLLDSNNQITKQLTNENITQYPKSNVIKNVLCNHNLSTKANTTEELVLNKQNLTINLNQADYNAEHLEPKKDNKSNTVIRDTTSLQLLELNNQNPCLNIGK